LIFLLVIGFMRANTHILGVLIITFLTCWQGVK
jgi:hypothetical protein